MIHSLSSSKTTVYMPFVTLALVTFGAEPPSAASLSSEPTLDGRGLEAAAFAPPAWRPPTKRSGPED
jgi:hypothetical protein